MNIFIEWRFVFDGAGQSTLRELDNARRNMVLLVVDQRDFKKNEEWGIEMGEMKEENGYL
jgi:hypothetical protein